MIHTKQTENEITRGCFSFFLILLGFLVITFVQARVDSEQDQRIKAIEHRCECDLYMGER